MNKNKSQVVRISKSTYQVAKRIARKEERKLRSVLDRLIKKGITYESKYPNG